MSRPKVWLHGESTSGFERIDHAIARYSPEPLTLAERRPVTIADRALLIYTSGTTGLPKAAHVSHRRLLQWSFWFAGLMNTTPHDRMYDCLPLYHSVGGVVATGALLVRGGSVLIRDRFSVRHFWDDVFAGDCTIFQYIGELCRYLVNAPEHPNERAHRLRLCCGNGLQADIWKKFQDRFVIPRILEFYASTEGNVSLYNVEGKIGSIGRVPPFLASRFPLALVQFDAGDRTAGARHARFLHPLRRRTRPAKRSGEFRAMPRKAANALKAIPTAKTPSKRSCTTCSRMATPGFAPAISCAWTRAAFIISSTGSATPSAGRARMSRPRKSPQRSRPFPASPKRTSMACACRAPKARAGMAAIVPDGRLDVAALRAHLAQRLPAYARPKFLRVAKELATTSTFKHTKNDLQRDGFDPAATQRRDLFRRSGERRFRAARPGAVRADQSRRGRF